MDQNRGAEFMRLYNQKHSIVEKGNEATLVLGRKEWPFPVPLVREKKGWQFDAEAGREEILNRWIGKNELSTIRSMRAYVEAQKLYYSLDPDKDGVKSFASRILSTPGKKDGLYWEDPAELSPFGPFVAAAEAEGYTTEGTQKRAFHGYFFKVLTAQGEHAKGGALDYFSDSGLMTQGFALLAYPAEWGESGIMTFQVNRDGRVYQKDLGENTAEAAQAIAAYNPDSSWELVKD
jgi:hypothetical protein